MKPEGSMPHSQGSSSDPLSSIMRRGRPQQSWKNQVTGFMKSRNMEEDMAENRHLWRLGGDGRILPI